jgi:hypothetical protein
MWILCAGNIVPSKLSPFVKAVRGRICIHGCCYSQTRGRLAWSLGKRRCTRWGWYV